MSLPLAAQDVVSYPVNLEVHEESLGFSRDSNCAGESRKGDVCVSGQYPGEIVFALGRGSEDWELARIQIRDPSANWGDRPSDRTSEDFPQFDSGGILQADSAQRGNLVIQDGNRHSIAVQYGITVRNRESGRELSPAFAVIDNDGGAGARGN